MKGAPKGAFLPFLIPFLLRASIVAMYGLPPLLHAESYTLKDDPQPQVLFTAAFSNLKPAASSVST